MKNPNPDILLRIAQADAYAAAVEYIKPGKYPQLEQDILKFEKYLQHPTHLKLKPGQYTDDCQMSLANAEVLLADDISIEAFANAWVECFKRDLRDGYARGFQKFLESIESGEEFLEKIISTSKKNGAAMRSVPFGLLNSVDEVVRVAELQAQITHDSILGTWGAIAVALMSHFAFHTDEDFIWLDTYVDDLMPECYSAFSLSRGSDTPPFNSRITNTYETVEAVCEVLQSSHSMMEMLEQIIKFGGDTDSAAAIAWGIGCARHPSETLPDFLEYCLEPFGGYGADYLRNVGRDLMTKFEVASD